MWPAEQRGSPEFYARHRGVSTPPRRYELPDCTCLHEDWQHGMPAGPNGCLVKGCLCPGQWKDEGAA